MFKKLRNKLVLTNLSILTVLLLAVFGSLYISTYNSVTSRSESEIDAIIERQQLPGNPTIPIDEPDNMIPIQSVSFSLEIEDGEIINALSRIELDDQLYENAYSLVDGNDGTITLDEQIWRYKGIETMNGTLITFLNVTNDQQLLSGTLTRFTIIFIISFVLVALISYFMTNRSIIPIRETFDKQKRFISDASHELKTPLTVINANVDVLLSQNTNKEDKKWLTYIQNEVVRMNKLTHNLLYLANVSNEEVQFVKSNINISAEVESSLLSVEALAYEKDIELKYTIEPNTYVTYNLEQFTQILMILLDNAIKYTPNKGVIDVSLTKTNNYVYFTINNTGNGIKEDDIPQLFDRFYKVDESRQNTSQSYGLGLSILKAICDNNNTKITVSSEVGAYTKFELRFPIK
jgi:signal transduction histidine kinase